MVRLSLKKVFSSTLSFIFIVLGILLISLSLMESIFFDMIVGQLLDAVQAKQITEQTLYDLNALVANGRISYMPVSLKLVMASIGIFIFYWGVNIAISIKGGDNSLRALFTADYWMKFNAIKYKKTRINNLS